MLRTPISTSSYFSRYAQKNRNCAGDSLNGQYGTIPSEGHRRTPTTVYFLAECFKLNTLLRKLPRITAIIERETKSVVIGDQRSGKSTASRPGYNTYSNLRFGYQIDYTRRVFCFQRLLAGMNLIQIFLSRSPQKMLFASPDKRAFLVLTAGNDRKTKEEMVSSGEGNNLAH